MEESSLFKNANLTECVDGIMGPKRDSFSIIIPIILIYVIIFLTGTVGNISTCIVISKNKSMHTATNYYLFSLAVSDLLLLITGLPQEIYLIYSRYPYVFGSTFCFLRGMFAETSANATVLTITAFTVERYVAICHPFLSHTMSKLSRAVKFIIVIWIIAIGLAIPQAMQFKIIISYGCEICYFVEPVIQYSFEVSTLLFFVLPMSLITVLYVLIGRRLKSSSNMINKRSVPGNSNATSQNRSSRKVVKMLVAVVVAFFVCWAPFHAQRLYSMYYTLAKHNDETHSLYLKIYEVVTYISGILYYVSATINPILYNIMSAKFREAFKETFSRCCGLSRFNISGPQRSYSVISRSAHPGPDSTDFCKDDFTLHSHTTVTQKSSLDSFNGVHSTIKRNKTFPSIRKTGIEEQNQQFADWIKDVSDINVTLEANSEILTSHRKCVSVQPNTCASSSKLNKFCQYFHCIAKRTFDESKGSVYYATPQKESNISFDLHITFKKENFPQHYDFCDISNSSLKDVENGAIEDELTTYLS